MAYTSEILIRETVELFQKHPEYRDDRWATMEYFIMRYFFKQSEFCHVEQAMMLAKLSHDADRAFRYVQQHVPSLRGTTWLRRQLQAGEITRKEYDAAMEDGLRKACNQLKLELVF